MKKVMLLVLEVVEYVDIKESVQMPSEGLLIIAMP